MMRKLKFQIKVILNYSIYLYRLCKNVLKRGSLSLKEYRRIIDIGNKSLKIIGNGPSVSSLNLDSSDNWDFVVVNDFVKSNLFEKLKPKYYVLFDPFYWVELHESQEIADRNDFFDLLIKKVCWDLVLILPLSADVLRVSDEIRSVRNISVVTVRDIPLDSKCSLDFRIYNIGLAIPPCRNVVTFAAYIGIFLGYRTISLFGVEHDWLKFIDVDENNTVIRPEFNYFDINLKENKINIWRKVNGENYKLHELLFDFYEMFYGYYKVSLYAEFEGVLLENYTKNSYIDSIKKVY